MGQQELLTVAKHGNERAIATLLNETLQKKGVTATCYRNGNYLQVVLVSAEVVEQSSSIHFIYDQLLRLKATSIRTVQVYGRQGDEQEHVWTEAFELSEPTSSTPKRTPRHRKENRTPSFVRKGIRRLSFLGTRFKLSDRANLPQPRQTKPKTKILLLLLTSFSWILFPLWGSAVRSQLSTPTSTNSNASKPLNLSDLSFLGAKKSSISDSSTKEKANSSSEAKKSSTSKPSPSSKVKKSSTSKSSSKDKADSSSTAVKKLPKSQLTSKSSFKDKTDSSSTAVKKLPKSQLTSKSSSKDKTDSSSTAVKKLPKSQLTSKFSINKKIDSSSLEAKKSSTSKSSPKKKADSSSSEAKKSLKHKSVLKKKRTATSSATKKRTTVKSLRKKKQAATSSATKKSSLPKSISNPSGKKKIKVTPLKPSPSSSGTKKPNITPSSVPNSSPKTQPSFTPLPAGNLSTPKPSPKSSPQKKLTPTPSATNKPSTSKSSPKIKQAPSSTENSAPVLPSNPTSKNPETSITIKAVGDIVPGTNFPNNRLPENNDILFKNVKSSLQGADILFGNFESTLTTYPNSTKDTSRPMVFAFRTPPVYAHLLKKIGFDVLSVANNHSMDFSPVGFSDTMKNLEKVGIKPVGKKNQIVYLNVNNIPVAFIGFSFLDVHNSMNNLAAAKALVAKAKEKAKIVVISVHAGAEGTDAMRVRNKEEMFYGEDRGNIVLFAHTLIDNGADLILGHGPHVARAMELYKGKMIAYSLGNFVGYRALSTEGVLGNSMILQVEMNSQGDFVSGKIIPVALDHQGIPHLDKQSRIVKMVGNLTKSDFPKSLVNINKKGQIAKQFRTYRYFTLDFESTKNSKAKS